MRSTELNKIRTFERDNLEGSAPTFKYNPKGHPLSHQEIVKITIERSLTLQAD